MKELLKTSNVISLLLSALMGILIWIYQGDRETIKSQGERITKLEQDFAAIGLDPQEVRDLESEVSQNTTRSLNNEKEIGDLFNKYDKAKDDAFRFLQNSRDYGRVSEMFNTNRNRDERK